MYGVWRWKGKENILIWSIFIWFRDIENNTIILERVWQIFGHGSDVPSWSETKLWCKSAWSALKYNQDELKENEVKMILSKSSFCVLFMMLWSNWPSTKGQFWNLLIMSWRQSLISEESIKSWKEVNFWDDIHCLYISQPKLYFQLRKRLYNHQSFQSR